MIGNIVNTIGSKLLIACISLTLLLLNSNYLGAEGLGSIGLIVLGITIILLVSNFVTGGGLIYYAPRSSVVELFFVSYFWVTITGLLFIPVVLFTPLFSAAYSTDILILGLILAAVSTHNNLLLGKEKVITYNTISISQAIIQLICLLYFFFIREDKTVSAFIISTYIAYISSFLISLLALSPLFKPTTSRPKLSFFTLFKRVLIYGLYLQIANIFQLLNYRLSYFLLQFYTGKAAVGIYTAGVQLSEGLLLPSRSLATVQYARIANMDSDKKSVRLSLVLMKAAFFITLPMLGVLLIIPIDYFSAFLGKEFSTVKSVIAVLSIGIVGLAMEGILSHFFSGTGRQKINSLNAIIGFIITLSAGFWLVPLYGVMGAAYTASLTYLGMLLFLVIQLRETGYASWSDFLPNSNDWTMLKKEAKNYFKRKT